MEPITITTVIQDTDMRLHAGERLTVWLQPARPGDGPIQVELRVTPAGNAEVYLNADDLRVVKSFDEWYSPAAFNRQEEATMHFGVPQTVQERKLLCPNC
jgi:hypothetical protein